MAGYLRGACHRWTLKGNRRPKLGKGKECDERFAASEDDFRHVCRDSSTAARRSRLSMGDAF